MKHALFIQSVTQALVATVITLLCIHVGFAQVRTSTSYQLQSDSLNFGGGNSTSTSYIQESTFGEIATGRSNSVGYSLRAGYQQMQEVFMSIAVSNDVTMGPSLPGLTGGESNGSTTVTVITDSPSGYQLTIQAENSPAMQSGANSIADYDDGGTPDFSFTTAAADAHLGYSPQGNDVVATFLDNGAACGVGALNTSLACWDGLTTSPVAVAQSAASNHPVGATTTIYFKVGIGGSAGVEAGTYTATSTVTALPL